MRTTGSFVVAGYGATKPAAIPSTHDTANRRASSVQESLSFDVVIVGAGPAGLATAYRLSSQARARGERLSICVLEKAARIGAHLLAGALLDPADLAALVPDWAERGAPLDAPVREESLHLCSRRQAWPLPIPPAWRHHGCRMVSLGSLCRWLASLAEAEGVEIFPGFAATTPLWEDDKLAGVVTGEFGRDRFGRPKPGFQPGTVIRASLTVLAEGCRGSLSGQIISRLDLDQGSFYNRDYAPQKYALGFREVWKTPGSYPGRVWHTLGWPLGYAGSQKVHGGGFLYQPRAEQTVLGLVMDLDYQNPQFDPFIALQQWKQHPQLGFLGPSAGQDAHLLSYGARTLSVGGWQSLPHLVFAGGVLVGDSGGFLNVATLQGIGNAIGSGILAADTLLQAWMVQDFSVAQLQSYPEAVVRSSWGKALYAVRNIRPGFRFGVGPGLLNAVWEKSVAGRSPWTFRWHQQDRERLQRVSQSQPPPHIMPQGALTHDRHSALASSGLRHEENQPLHLQLRDPNLLLTEGRLEYANPETRFCPAAVFEVCGQREAEISFHIHANHCLHCKCCDIKDPLNNIRWTAPQGGSGPDYLGTL